MEDFFENGALGLHIVAADGTILRANRSELQFMGYEPEEYIGQHIADFHADAETIADILSRLARGETLNNYPARLRTKGGEIKNVLISSSVCFDEAGTFLNTRCFTVDITERLRAEEALRETQQRLSVTYDHALVGISEVDQDGRFLRTNDALTQLTGYAKEELVGCTVFSITHPEDVKADAARYRRQVAGEFERYTIEKRYVCADGRIIWVHVLSATVRDPRGAFLYAVRVAHEVTEQKRAEERYQLLINELNHRVKNTLSTVQSFARQTARTSDDLHEFMGKFDGRLMALSQAHNRLTRRKWEGASLLEIVTDELALHGGTQRGLVASGPDVSLTPRAALALSMALHELGTNAGKHGALAAADGTVQVRWAVQRDDHSQPIRVDLEWSEGGGPPVAVPNRTGFGSRLLEAMAEELQGDAALLFEPAGLRWLLGFPLELRPELDASGCDVLPPGDAPAS